MPDLVHYAIHKMDDHDPAKGLGKRFTVAAKNLTDDEAADLLLAIAVLQQKREAV